MKNTLIRNLSIKVLCFHSPIYIFKEFKLHSLAGWSYFQGGVFILINHVGVGLE